MGLENDRWIDITRKLGPNCECWPGDRPFGMHHDSEIGQGGFRVSSVSGSLHLATHVDAPSHCLPDGDDVDQLDINLFIGLAEVIDLAGHAIPTPEILALNRRGTCPRLLIKNARHCLDIDAARWVLDNGIALVGCDGPSIACSQDELRVHHLLLSGKTVIIESLDLSAINAGIYDFIGLPLNITGAEAAWLRAAIRYRRGN